MRDIRGDNKMLKNSIGLGVAGNFAHHLEQAGELKDFENVVTKELNAPKGIFPFYVPNSKGFLSLYPIDDKELSLPKDAVKAQVEPEVAILFDIEYDKNFKVFKLVAKKFTAFNDCTIRKEGANKISEKKSWSENSKGMAKEWINIDKFEEGGVMDNFHLCSFVKRDGKLHKYGVDAPLLGYSYFYKKLENWLLEKMNEQKDFGPLEDISEHLKDCSYPKQALISIGATAYTEFGEKNYLELNDEIYVVVYDKRKGSADIKPAEDKIILHQKVC
ncbi:MAG: Unknown protein [uncultured Sulfurovum sp.]|uniref:Uncharacterized protein n=1 Tax=uncultured Sulfurovum sp. TaxID=269237 RepID=A0A6S6TU48_9BACT|nr:MAG: Unknown protein [uncultured Sulfurovum sp.]